MYSARSILSPTLVGLALLAAPALTQQRVDPATSQAAHRQAKQSNQVKSKQDRPQKAKSQKAKPHRPEKERAKHERGHAAPDQQHESAASQRRARRERQHQAAQGHEPAVRAGQQAPPVRRPEGAAGTLTKYPSRVQGTETQGAATGQRPATEGPASRWERVDPAEAESIERTQRALNERQARGSADPGRTPSDPDPDAVARERAAQVPDSPAIGRPRTEDPAVIEARRRGASTTRNFESQAGSSFDIKLQNERRAHQERINKLNYSREISLQMGSTQRQRRIESMIAKENARYEQAAAKLAQQRNAKRIEEIKRNPEPTLNRLDARNATRGEPAPAERPERVEGTEPVKRPESPERIEP